MRKIIPVFIFFLILFQSCHYRPYLKYYFPSKSTHLPKFSKWAKTVGSHANPHRAFDITCYDWQVHVNPVKQNINACMKLYFSMTAAQDTIMLDLQNHLKIDAVKSSMPLKKYKRKKDVLFIVFDKEVAKNEKVVLEISYHGKPVHMLDNSAINWEKDKNNKPWIGTTTEGVGPHHMMPCKNMLYDEPDSCFIRVGVPKDLVGVANGKLDSITETVSEKMYHWSVHNPINVYNISFNVGNYVKLEKTYKDVYGTNRHMQFYVLDYNKAVADTFYDQAPLIMQRLENLYGVYPWWNDGFKIVETNLPNDLCMEHQSSISMSNAYANRFMGINLVLVHEMAHEWWGNNVSAFDYADLWLHEGFAEYSEALFAEAHWGKKYYYRYIFNFLNATHNKRPVMKPYDLGYNNLIHHDDQDIYSKGALLLHTLRVELHNDSLFFRILKTAQQRFAKKNITGKQFMTFFNEEAKKDFTSFFDVYLKQISPPVLEYSVNKSNADTAVLEYKWLGHLPENFTMRAYFAVGDHSKPIYPAAKVQQFKFPAKERYGFDIVASGYFLLREKKK